MGKRACHKYTRLHAHKARRAETRDVVAGKGMGYIMVHLSAAVNDANDALSFAFNLRGREFTLAPHFRKPTHPAIPTHAAHFTIADER